MNEHKLVIIGAGQAAAGVARGLREGNFQGNITVVGDESHPPYERPPLSKDFLSDSGSAERLYLLATDWWSANKVTLLLGCRAEDIDRARKTVALSNGEQLEYDTLVIATGGRPRFFTPAGAPVSGVQHVRTIDDARGLSASLSTVKSLCVIGGGFLGLEIAGSARQMGLEVTVLEAGARLLPRVFPAELSAWLKRLHEANGIDVVCDANIKSVTRRDGGGYAVDLGAAECIEADSVVACVGMEPNVQLAVDAGLVVDNGIVVDAQCRTSDPAIYAVGDVASQIDLHSGRTMRTESWQNAEHQAAVCAAAIAGTAAPVAPVPWFWSDQLGKNIQVAGAPQTWDQLVWRGNPEDGPFAAFLLHRGRVAGGIAVNLGREMTPLRQLIQLNACPDAEKLASADCSLRSLVAAARAATSVAS
jgi:3-phenylpropionate/trans-cinnamate dioxygenase ferredoxin reductase subunit